MASTIFDTSRTRTTPVHYPITPVIDKVGRRARSSGELTNIAKTINQGKEGNVEAGDADRRKGEKRLPFKRKHFFNSPLRLSVFRNHRVYIDMGREEATWTPGEKRAKAERRHGTGKLAREKRRENTAIDTPTKRRGRQTPLG